MPGSGTVPSSQGSYVAFGGSTLGSLLSIRVSAGGAAQADTTSMSSAVYGDTIRKETDVIGLEPGTVSVTFFGVPSGIGIGSKDDLEVVMDDGTVVSGEAFVTSYEVEATVGDLIRGSAAFQFTGSEGSS